MATLTDYIYNIDFSKDIIILDSTFYNNNKNSIKAKKILDNNNIQYIYIKAHNDFMEKIMEITGSKVIPQIFVNGEFIGGVHNLKNKLSENENRLYK